jgi:hypothetical protein
MSGQHGMFAGQQQCRCRPGLQLGRQFPAHEHTLVKTDQFALVDGGEHGVATDRGNDVAPPVGTVQSVP